MPEKARAKTARPGDDPLARETWGMLASLVYPPRLIDVARAMKLTPATVSALARLPEPRTMGEMAVDLRCDPSNVTGIVDALEARGLAARKPSAEDRRVKVVELTAKGQRLRGRVMGELSEPPAWLLDLSEKDRRALRDVLRRAREGVG